MRFPEFLVALSDVHTELMEYRQRQAAWAVKWDAKREFPLAEQSRRLAIKAETARIALEDFLTEYEENLQQMSKLPNDYGVSA